MLLKNRMSFSENLLNKDLEFIKNFLRNGFYFVKVNSSINKMMSLIRLELN